MLALRLLWGLKILHSAKPVLTASVNCLKSSP